MTKEQIKTELNRLFENVMQADVQLRHFEAIYYYVDFIKRTPILWEIVDAKEGGEYEKATKYIQNPERTREEKNLRHNLSRVANVWHVFGFMNSVYGDWKEVQESGPEAADAMGILKHYAKGDLQNPVRLKYRIGDQVIDEDKEFRAMNNRILNYLLLEKEERPSAVVKPANIKAEFFEKENAIKIGGQAIPLPPFKDEYCLCKVLFEHGLGEPIGWEVAYKEMTGNESPKKYAKAKKKVSDTCRRLNGRIRLSTGIEDFIVSEAKTIKRQY